MALFNIQLHLDPVVVALLVDIRRELISKGNIIMEKITELAAAAAATKEAVLATKAAVDQLPAKIDTLEAKVTAAISNAGLSDEDKANIETALADLRGATTAAQEAATTATTAGADADDGVDEGAAGPG